MSHLTELANSVWQRWYYQRGPWRYAWVELSLPSSLRNNWKTFVILSQSHQRMGESLLCNLYNGGFYVL